MSIVFQSRDPTLSTVDIEKIMSQIENNDYLKDKTSDSICEDVVASLGELSNDLKEQFCKKLVGYRHIENICDLRMGRFTRWIPLDPSKIPVLQSGGMAVNVKIEDDVQIVCKTYSRRGFLTCRFNESIVFQKMSEEENLILLANEYLQRI